jgi:hypothetical protein
MTTKNERICGNETLGTAIETDMTSPYFGTIAIPPVLSNQLELILYSSILSPLKKSILGKLQDLISANKPANWFTVYLCVFILLHVCAVITARDCQYARQHGIPV